MGILSSKTFTDSWIPKPYDPKVKKIKKNSNKIPKTCNFSNFFKIESQTIHNGKAIQVAFDKMLKYELNSEKVSSKESEETPQEIEAYLKRHKNVLPLKVNIDDIKFHLKCFHPVIFGFTIENSNFIGIIVGYNNDKYIVYSPSHSSYINLGEEFFFNPEYFNKFGEFFVIKTRKIVKKKPVPPSSTT